MSESPAIESAPSGDSRCGCALQAEGVQTVVEVGDIIEVAVENLVAEEKAVASSGN